eukprot:488411_1
MEDFEVQDLNGVEFDVLNVIKLFKELLNYQCFPKYEEYPKLYGNSITWTKKQLMDLLTRRAIHLNENIYDNENPSNVNGRYDGLVFIISAHGWNANIITSDYQLVTKKDIHRIFTAEYPKTREIPRVFIYDCCDGHNEFAKAIKKRRNNKTDITVFDIKNDKGKNTSLTSVYTSNKDDDEQSVPVDEPEMYSRQFTQQEKLQLWKRGEQNPDYLLATLHACNLDFQSKLNTIKGSYFIQQFVDISKQYLNNDKDMPFIGEIFHQIQTDLSQRKQLPEYTWNNGTNNIKFKKKKYNKNFKKKK